MIHWERKKSGFYRLIHTTNTGYREEGIIAEVVRGADGRWWMEFLDRVQGWICKRCKSLGNAKAVAEECCKQ